MPSFCCNYRITPPFPTLKTLLNYTLIQSIPGFTCTAKEAINGKRKRKRRHKNAAIEPDEAEIGPDPEPEPQPKPKVRI